MISHKLRCIFIHIPKCAGSSINKFLWDDKKLDWKIPNYEVLYGWCPKRKIHLQHATSKQLLETELITEQTWDEYYKFTFVRNPWDRAYSDYLWIMNDTKIKDTFKEYIYKSGNFKEALTNKESRNYRGDHLLQQTDFFDIDGFFNLNFVGRFENLMGDLDVIKSKLNISKNFSRHDKKNLKRFKHYSQFYNLTKKRLVEEVFPNDINKLGYSFNHNKKGLKRLKYYF